ncbi:MAG: hypothetical protein A2V66_01850 [Ignavibacteria bacterium RBG_13_36_8]|nr:MAG: hypothetical protein A2V66_01850 [Ignavibacteria bacterium RBG_13_36_8]
MIIKTTCWEFEPESNRKLVFYFHFLGWYTFQIGIHFDFQMLNVEIHLPFCFMRFGLKASIKNCVYKENKDD